jgi:hypothetical protein
MTPSACPRNARGLVESVAVAQICPLWAAMQTVGAGLVSNGDQL